VRWPSVDASAGQVQMRVVAKLDARGQYINSISIADYRGAKNTIDNNIVIPTGFYRIYYKNDAKFEKCFYY
jgi:hypothetical protein